MSDTHSDQPVVYQIKIDGHLRPQWTDWFEGLSVTLQPDGTTLLSLLKKVRDTGLTLIAVNQISSKQEQA